MRIIYRENSVWLTGAWSSEPLLKGHVVVPWQFWAPCRIGADAAWSQGCIKSGLVCPHRGGTDGWVWRGGKGESGRHRGVGVGGTVWGVWLHPHRGTTVGRWDWLSRSILHWKHGSSRGDIHGTRPRVHETVGPRGLVIGRRGGRGEGHRVHTVLKHVVGLMLSVVELGRFAISAVPRGWVFSSAGSVQVIEEHFNFFVRQEWTVLLEIKHSLLPTSRRILRASHGGCGTIVMVRVFRRLSLDIRIPTNPGTSGICHEN